MTTIATDGKSMAGDSLITGGGYRCGYRKKVFRGHADVIFGCAGFTDDMIAFQRFMTDGGENPELQNDFEALALKPDGTIHYISYRLEWTEYLSPMAIGSGGELALGAMLMGATPDDAVSVAARRDTRTGGTVHVEWLNNADT